MADIKFRCPECEQKIAVDASAAGVKIDCPTCHSRLVIPRSELAPVEVLVKRKLAIVGGSADAVYSELQKAQAQAEKAADEIKELRAQQATAAMEARKDVEALLAARESQEEEIKELRPLREKLEEAKKSLAEAAQREVQLNVSAANAGALRAELTGLQATHAETQSRLSTMAEQLGALQRERDELAKAAAEAAALRDQIAGARKEIDRAFSEAKTADEANRTLSAQLDTAKGAETGLRAELAAVQTRHTQAETRIAEQMEKLAALEAERMQLAGIVEELLPLREELAKSQRDLCNISESTAEKVRGYESQLETAKNSVAQLRASLGDLQSKHAAAQNQTAEQTARLEMAVKRVAELQSEAAAAKSLREQFVNSQNELERIRKQAEKGAQEREEAARKKDEALSKTQAAEKALREYSDALQAKLLETEKRHAGIAHGFTALKQERTELTNELSASWKERDDAAAKNAAQLMVIEKLTAEAEAAQGKLARLREDASAAAVEKGRIAAALEKVTADRAELIERGRQRDALEAANEKEIANLKLLVASAEAGAKNRDTQLQLLTARTESLTGIVAEREAAAHDALARAEKKFSEHQSALDRAQKAERDAAGAAERAKKGDEEKAALAAELDQLKAQQKHTPPGSTAPTEREKSLEAERDALTAALDRAKQHVGVLQARRDMLRDEVATLRSRLGIGGQITSADEKPIAK